MKFVYGFYMRILQDGLEEVSIEPTINKGWSQDSYALVITTDFHSLDF